MIPVIIIHQGYSNYLEYTIKQACANNKVILISDVSNEILHENFKSEDLNKYDSGFDFFENNYVHMNTTPKPYELFCFKRWFILKNYLEKNNIDKIFYIDSDVLLFCNIEKEYPKFDQYEITLTHRTAAISSFMNYNAIKNFCNMVNEVYNKKDSFLYKKLESHYRIRQECGLPGGVCDMTLFELFHYHSNYGGGPSNVGEMMHIIDNSTYDHNLNVSDNEYEMSNSIKNVKNIDGVPYVFNFRLNKDIKFNCLHFQGDAKKNMKTIYEKFN
jgi:hypothetical protein